MISVVTFTLLVLAQTFVPPTIDDLEKVGEGFTFTEGPLWIPETGWIFSDVRENAIYKLDHTAFRSGSNNSNGLALDLDGRLLVCESLAKRITRTETDGSTTELVGKYNGKPFNAPNDLVVHSTGWVYFTDPKPLRGESEIGHSGVYRVHSRSSEIELISDKLDFPNGIGLSPNEEFLYVSDTSNGKIVRFSLDSDGLASGPQDFCKVRIPDGFAIDDIGRIWTSSSVGITIFSATGQNIGVIRIKGMPTNCAFGGVDKKTLLVTARKNIFKVIMPEANN